MSVITITRGPKSGGLELAKLLSEKLGYKILSREVIIESAKKYNIMENLLLDKLENVPSMWQKFTSDYERYIIYIRCALLDAIKEDNIIYIGYAGQFFLQDIPHVLKLRIEASMTYRMSAVMTEFNYNDSQAKTYIAKADEQRKRWAKLVCNKDWYDTSLYDLWINLQNMSMDNICNSISTAISHEDFITTENSKRILYNKSLECEIRAALSCDDKLWDQEISINAQDGMVILRGRAKNEEIRDLIIESTEQVKGVKNCASEINLILDPLTRH